MSTLGKPQRQHRILRILEDQPVSSQAQLVQMLEADGIVATQATVSRDLEDLGAVKVRIPGGAMAYAIPDGNRERAPSDDHLKRLLGEFVVEVAFSDLQVSARYPGGFALRLARVKRYRDDKRAEDADTMESVRRIYALQAGAS